MKISVKTDARGGIAKTRTLRREMANGMRTNAAMSGKMAAWQCHYYTKVASKKEITSDVRKAYGVIGEEGWEYKAYYMIKEYKGQDKANEWFAIYKGYSKEDANRDIESESKNSYKNPIEEFHKIRFPGGKKTAKESEYLALRKENNYTIFGGKDPRRKVLGMVTFNNRNKLEEKRMNTRGLAKMAWKACFEKLNKGRKSNVVSVMGEEKREFDKRYKKSYEKFGKQSLGSAYGTYNKNGFKVTITNHVRYADIAFHDHARSKVSALVTKYMKTLFDLRKKNACKAAAAASRRRAEIKMAA